jgi:VWFA-related protein
MRLAGYISLSLLAALPVVLAQPGVPNTASSPVSMIVTVEARHGKTIPEVNREDVMVYDGNDRLRVTDWVPQRGGASGLELFVLLDDALDTSFGGLLEELRQFIRRQPDSTAIAIGYMRNGTVETLQPFTIDHAQAAQKLRLPLGSSAASPSPYFSLQELIKRWPAKPFRREVLMISDGIDRVGDSGPANPYVDSTVQMAQRAGIVVYTIYAAGGGHYGHSMWRVNWGQNYLSQIADQTGGEAYFQGFQTPISLRPYLDELAERLNHQYRLTFAPKPQKKPGFQRIKLKTEVPNAELVGAERVDVPATP